MTSTIKGFQELAIKVGLISFKNWAPGHGGCPLTTHEAVTLTLLVPTCKTIRQIGLCLAQNINCEEMSSLDEPIGTSVLRQRYHDGQRSNGNGTERIASHSVEFVSFAARHNGHSRNESRHDFAELIAV